MSAYTHSAHATADEVGKAWLITEIDRLREKLTGAEKALQFYCDGDHFDIATVGSFTGQPTTGRVTRIIDTGAVAEEALAIIREE